MYKIGYQISELFYEARKPLLPKQDNNSKKKRVLKIHFMFEK